MTARGPAPGPPASVEHDRPDLAGPGAKAEFARLFDSYARTLRGYLAGRVGAHAADDLVAETFLIAFRRRDSYDATRVPVRGWLYGIATNVLRNHRRDEIRGLRATARAGHFGGSEHNEPHDNRVAARVDAEHRMRGLADGLADLSDDERDALLLTSWAGLEPGELAAALGVPASTVRTRLHRARRKLRGIDIEQGTADNGGENDHA
ncbi:RNA polymerase sigma factor [Solihabitans fulvus]|uniref:RNA polymerase sigma factor n=1 Tax=Solihabitans fulvus TaxID=1892852 RepID=A0A5B2WRM8_9PSEU|nr:RNA polymerase sigma factor [Solihabitans fulvus]